MSRYETDGVPPEGSERLSVKRLRLVAERPLFSNPPRSAFSMRSPSSFPVVPEGVTSSWIPRRPSDTTGSGRRGGSPVPESVDDGPGERIEGRLLGYHVDVDSE
jgi:hypothetical protein